MVLNPNLSRYHTESLVAIILSLHTTMFKIIIKFIIHIQIIIISKEPMEPLQLLEPLEPLLLVWMMPYHILFLFLFNIATKSYSKEPLEPLQLLEPLEPLLLA